MKEFKIRCSALSQIMGGNVGLTEIQATKLNELSNRKFVAGTNGVKPLTVIMEKELAALIHKKENPELPDGAKTYVKKWLKQTLFNRFPEWKAIVVEKGLCCEPDSIKLLNEILGETEIHKNDEFFENEYAEGNPDIIFKDVVRDIKNSWDLFTFPMFDDELPNEDYWWQLQGYMWLTGLKKASLDYTLIDTPQPLVMLDLKKLYFQSGGKADDWNPEAYELMYPNYRYDDIPKELRLKSFEFEYDSTVEAKIKERVLLCREYIKKIYSGEEKLD